MARLVLAFILAVRAAADLRGELLSFPMESPSEKQCGPKFCFNTQTANCFAEYPADVCMKAVYMCVKFIFVETKPEEFCQQERKKGNAAAIDALATLDKEPREMQQMPFAEAIWLLFLIVFALGILLKHFLARPKKEIRGLKMPLLCDAV
mmetsp:Transcript_4484/g.10461  ORF Transcript_4484/g.10461 Transcript_4484/m.10461 type:complete len:150 (-) Transcript_4484:110-559(-)|eukprot:s86_g3.t1